MTSVLRLPGGAAGLASRASTIRLLGSRHVTSGVSYSIAASGYVRRKARLQVFVDFHSCAPTPRAERQHKGAAEARPTIVHGPFSRTYPWRSTVSRQTLDHACGYVVDMASGRLAARARFTYIVVPKRSHARAAFRIGYYPPTALSCPSSFQCTELDSVNGEVTFNPLTGHVITRLTIDTQPLGNVACPSTTQCTLMDSGGYAVTFDPQSSSASGFTFLPIKPPVSNYAPFLDVACPSVNQCTTVDDVGYEVTFNPRSSVSPTRVAIAGRNSELGLLTCPSIKQCTAVEGRGGQITFNPHAPRAPVSAQIGLPYYVAGLSCPTARQGTAVGTTNANDYSGEAVTFNPLSAARSAPKVVYRAALRELACPSSAQCTTLDPYGTEVTFNPRSVGSRSAVRIWSDGQLAYMACPRTEQCTTLSFDGGEFTLSYAEITFDSTRG